MKKLASMLAAAALAIGFASTADAQGNRQPGQGRGMGGGFGGGSVYTFLSTNKPLQEELKITDEQKKKLEEVAKEQQTKMGEVFRGGGFGRDATDEQRKEMAEKMAKLAAESKKAYEGVLTKEQAKRTTQINYQYLGVRAFSDKEVQTALKFSDEQKEQIKSITDEYSKDARELRGNAQPGERPSEEDRKKMEEKGKALRKDAEEKIAAKLNDDQKKAWKELIGEKFDTTKLVFERRPRDN